MQVYDAKNIRQKDKLAEKRRKALILKILFCTGSIIVAAGFIFYLLFFSGSLKIKEISVSGLNQIDSDSFMSELNKKIDSKIFGWIEYQSNVLFFDSDSFKSEIVSMFPQIKSVSIHKNPPHSLSIEIKEREMTGVWCFGGTGGRCRYFDKEGAVWGEAIRSSGFLILTIEDNRDNGEEIDTHILDSLLMISNKLKDHGLSVSKFIFPAKYIGDFKVLTSNGYYLMFSMDSDLVGQIEALKTLLSDKQSESNGFKPQYIDLRINGRIYFK